MFGALARGSLHFRPIDNKRSNADLNKNAAEHNSQYRLRLTKDGHAHDENGDTKDCQHGPYVWSMFHPRKVGPRRACPLDNAGQSIDSRAAADPAWGG
jgi:hypothetical protein